MVVSNQLTKAVVTAIIAAGLGIGGTIAFVEMNGNEDTSDLEERIRNLENQGSSPRTTTPLDDTLNDFLGQQIPFSDYVNYIIDLPEGQRVEA